MRYYLSIWLLLNIPFYSVALDDFHSDVDCPPKCQCSKYSITCTIIGQSGSDIFIPIRPEAFPELDSVTVTGGKIGDISRQNLFGMDVVHQKLTFLNISNSGVTAFDSETFRGLPSLQWFYLNDNSIEKVGQDPFRWNPYLTQMSLSRAFSSSISVSNKHQLLTKTFVASTNRFKKLNDLFLNDNHLQTLPPDVFCDIDSLVQLHLAGNNLKEFNFTPRCLSSLKRLDLSNNELISPPPQIWDDLQSLQVLDISLNPLHCDCKLYTFIERMRESTSQQPLNQGKTFCSSPKSAAGQNVFDKTDFDCESSEARKSGEPQRSFIIIIALGCLILLCIIVLRVYRGRLRFANLPFVAGYTKLGTNEAVTPQAV